MPERIAIEIEKIEKMLCENEIVADDEMTTVYKKMKTYSGEQQLIQEMVQALINKVFVMDSEYVEIVWKFSDKIYNFIMG